MNNSIETTATLGNLKTGDTVLINPDWKEMFSNRDILTLLKVTSILENGGKYASGPVAMVAPIASKQDKPWGHDEKNVFAAEFNALFLRDC